MDAFRVIGRMPRGALRICLCLLIFLPWSVLLAQSAGSQDVEPQDGRPYLQHQAQPIQDYKIPTNDRSRAPISPEAVSPAAPLVAPGLHLPVTGLVWALDTVAGKSELVHLKYTVVNVDSHKASNILKAQAAPFIYKPKMTIELNGAAAAVRLHEASPVLFVRDLLAGEQNEAESDASSAEFELTLIRLKTKGDRRIAATIAFTQFTANASRSTDVIEVTKERLPRTNWYRLRPKEPLPAGEYGLMCLPQKQDLFGSQVYDFAIDPTAPENKDAIAAASGK
jgi:hypothetical protein